MASHKPKVVYYFPNWCIYARGYPPKSIPLDFVDEITYAFFALKPNAAGFYVPTLTDAWADTDKKFGDEESVEPFDSVQPHQPFYGNFNQIKKLKAKKPSFCVGMSIGGWTMSAHFSDAVATPQSQLAFAEGVLDVLRKYPGIFSTIDFDWEYISPGGKNYGQPGNVVRPDDGQNFVRFLHVMRKRLDETGCGAIKLTAAVVGTPEKLDGLPVEAMNQYIDEFRVMTYDFGSSAWGPCAAGHQANLYPTPYGPQSGDRAIKAYLSRGVPAHKLFLGVAFYSRGFANTAGLGHPSSGVVHNKSVEDGVSEYRDLPVPGATEFWDPVARAGYCYDPRTKDLNSYDTTESVKEKCAYVHQHGLGGLIVWEISGDVRDVNHPRSLIRAISAGLRGQ
ncbi:glycoside hydrolase family 18 protein [Gonapodya prolifera JEL478]|uniref:Glycoside hydrolase family 18 protein n=1 Tax=Gonapodya prolifera (strain JEL478) TaxID=1344416 RepID=A0A139A8B2_GONPJ|nr:glycoside hydrolase family 18 protein [Gonapodya prolifera JEL478]|eukprot:KXS12939.1 glycoside hydrolase family 18 protein [Gonapodya prolifera JEL478]